MGTVTVRVSTDTRDRIAELAHKGGISMAKVLDEAVEDYERKKFFEELNEQIASTKADPEAWAAYQAETAVFDGAAADGLAGLDDTDYSTW